MLDLLLGPSLTRWGPLAVTYVRENPWQVFAAAVVALFLLRVLFSDRYSDSADFPELGGIGSGDGDGGAD